MVETAWLAHSRSQDSLLPIRHLLINSETESRVKWLLLDYSVCWTGVSAGSKLCARGEVVLTCECVCCVSGIAYQPQPQQKPQIHTMEEESVNCLEWAVHFGYAFEESGETVKETL